MRRTEIKYFAYGSNLFQWPDSRAECLGPAKLDDHMLAFTRQSVTWGAGAADIMPRQGMTVWGVLFEIDESEEARLDRKEGVDHAYRKTKVKVLLNGKTLEDATAYTVIEKELPEIAPSSEYLDKLIRGAKQHELPPDYVVFLESLEEWYSHGAERGLIMEPTVDRADAKGAQIVKVSPSVARDRRLKNHVVVDYRGAYCAADLRIVPGLKDDSARVDQSIREAIGVTGPECYGVKIELHPLRRRGWAFRLVRPRTLVLPVQRASRRDCEKDICVMHEKNIALLGLEEGGYVELKTLVRTGSGEFEVRKRVQRVFSGIAEKVRPEGLVEQEYPLVENVYLDLDSRQSLTLVDQENPAVVTVSASVRRLFLSRMLYYGIALFLSVLSIEPYIAEVLAYASETGTDVESASLGVTLAISILATLGLSVADLRGKVQY